jgi:hypothetical protein
VVGASACPVFVGADVYLVEYKYLGAMGVGIRTPASCSRAGAGVGAGMNTGIVIGFVVGDGMIVRVVVCVRRVVECMVGREGEL